MTGLDEDRRAIRRRLLDAGWKVSAQGRFDPDDANLEHTTAAGDLLEVQQGENVNRNRFFCFYVTYEDGQGVHFNIHFEDDPKIRDSIVEYIANHKDEFSSATLPDHLRAILKLGPRVFVDTDGDLVPLTDDDDAQV